MKSRYPQDKTTITGAGIVGGMEAYKLLLISRETKESNRVSIYEQNQKIEDTTAANIFGSFTPDEMASVIPPGPELEAKSKILFSEPGGIKVVDVEGTNDSVTEAFIQEVIQYSENKPESELRVKKLISQVGKKGMDGWQEIWDKADPKFRKILEESNFQPCREPRNSGEKALHDGYRIDLIYKDPNALKKAAGMIADYKTLGYEFTEVLFPEQVQKMDPFLSHFCEDHSEINAEGVRVWKENCIAVFRPGGCIDVKTFIPKLYAYLKEEMGQYVSEDGTKKDCFQLKLGKKVEAVIYSNSNKAVIEGLKFADGTEKQNKHPYRQSNYVFCPGESVGTLKKLGFKEPAAVGFAGASLVLKIPVPQDKIKEYSQFNHCMEVHQEGVVLAWQARFIDDHINPPYISIGGAGTKALYGTIKPEIAHAFAKNRHILQFNMMNDVLPDFVSLALNRDTRGQVLTDADLAFLVESGIATPWVGTRAVASNSFLTVGPLYNEQGKVLNARTTTHLGSGGCSYAPAAVDISRSAMEEKSNVDPAVLAYASSLRKPGMNVFSIAKNNQSAINNEKENKEELSNAIQFSASANASY